MSEEKKGELYTFASGVIWAFFPIITILSLSSVPSLIALLIATGFSCVFFFIVMLIKGKIRELANPQAWKYGFVVALLIGALYYGIYFIGLSFTTPGNASLVALFEVLTSFLFFTLFRKEPFKKEYIVGSALMLLGAGIVLFNNFTGINKGDFLILLAMFVAPLGNLFQQKLKKAVHMETAMFLRTLMTVPMLLVLVYIFNLHVEKSALTNALPFLALNGIIILGLSRGFWMEAISRITVTKVTALVTFVPFLTLILSWLILDQKPTVWQLMALPFLIIGIFILTDNLKLRKSISSTETGVIFALVRDRKILMQQRDEKCKRFPLAWCIPGGVKEEYDLTYEDTLLREVKEEFDLDLNITDCVCFMEYNDSADKVYVCKVASTQEPKLQEGLAMKWMTMDEVEKMKLGFHQEGIVPELKKVLSLDNY